MINKSSYIEISQELEKHEVTLVAVSKTKPLEDILELYDLGQKDFGENYVQEMLEKSKQLPPGIRWHFIGHLQSNKVKLIIPFVQLIHGVDSLKLLEEINKQSQKINKVTDCLLQVHIAKEETKFGLDETELEIMMNHLPGFKNVQVKGLMGMASFTEDEKQVRKEFRFLNSIYQRYPGFTVLSMGMSGDYKIAIEEGSNMVRIGSLLFGARN